MSQRDSVSKDYLTARFRKGDRVVWNTVRGGREPHWVVDGIEVSEGLQPIYRVRHEQTGEVGSAVQWDLEPAPSSFIEAVDQMHRAPGNCPQCGRKL